jgi:hypothetical protein
MLLQIARKTEYQSLIKQAAPTPLFDEKELASIVPRYYNMIGKDIVL